MKDSDSTPKRGGRRVLQVLTWFVLLPFFLLMNACSLAMEEERDAASSGLLTAKVILINGGAMSDYEGVVWVLPQYFPRVWPLTQLVGCRALMFKSDPRVDVAWEDASLMIEHDHFAYPITTADRCYGREIRLLERQP